MTSAFGARAISCVLMVFAMSSLIQVPDNLPWEQDVVPALGLFQFFGGVSGIVASVAAWRRARWAAIATLVYGLISIAFVFSLGAMLDLPAEATKGFPLGVAVLAAAFGAMAWYLSRSSVRHG